MTILFPTTTEYGYRRADGVERYTDPMGVPFSREDAETIVKGSRGFTLIARDVSASRVVSIR